MEHTHDPQLWKDILAALIKESRTVNDDLRFGQLLYRYISKHYENAPTADIGDLLFYIEDDTLAKIIEDM